MIKIDLSSIPNKPGVYIFKDINNEIIYVGKASSLRKRIKSYFYSKEDIDIKTNFLITKTKDFEYIITENEYSALILENELIKKYRPKYNVRLRDDKTYPYIKITKETFPSLQIVRKLKNDGGIYFGPYPRTSALRGTLKLLRTIFPIRTCRINLDKKKNNKPCLDYQIKICSAPCANEITKSDYKKLIKGTIFFIEGRYSKIVKKLKKEMQCASKNLEFEKAAKLRDQIFQLEETEKKEKIKFETQREIDEKLFGKKEIEFMKIASCLKETFSLSRLPELIEGIDVSNISGKYPTGSVVVFERGVPNKEEYRRYKIKNISQIDDYKMIKEVVNRRYSRLIFENKRLPDLILIDGGRGHFNAASLALKELNLNIDIISIAKEQDEIFFKDTSIILKDDSDELHFIQRIRDEAHRFARKYHTILREKY